jgi:ACS family 4-hydroxyphenylacetate permease-like MFS transporter
VFLSDSPAKAKWLNDKEKAALLRRMEREQKAAPQHKSVKVWSEVFSRNMLILALMDLGMVAGLNTMAVWTPQIVREVIKAHNFSSVGLFTAIPAVAAFIAMPFWGSHSDRKMERSWHFAAPMAAAGVGWALVALSHRPEVRMLGLILCTLGPLIAQTIYWVIASHVMSPAARAVGFAFVNTCAMAAAAFMPLLIGFLRDRTHSWVAALLFTAFMLIVAAAVTFLIPANEGIRPAEARS